MKKLFILLSIVLLSSCVTQKACLERFPIVERHDTTIIYRDTIITVPVFSVDDTTVVWGTVFDTVYASSGTAHAITYVIHDTLKLITWQSDTTITLKLDSALQVIALQDREMLIVQQKCEKSKVERALMWLFYIALVVGFVFLIKFFTKLVK